MEELNMEQEDLNVDQARQRVLSALAERWRNASFRVRDDATLVREYGWVFTLEVDIADKKNALTNEAAIPCLALVNKTSAQAVSTSRAYSPEQFAKVFEGLLARNRTRAGNWCLTMDGRLGRKRISIADAARTAGLEEL
jgi:hypothetical protein